MAPPPALYRLAATGWRRPAWLRDAVQSNFAVIGEALAQLNKTDPAVAQQITEWHRIIGFRNQLIHGYAIVHHGITWEVIKKKAPVLRLKVQRLLGMP